MTVADALLNSQHWGFGRSISLKKIAIKSRARPTRSADNIEATVSVHRIRLIGPWDYVWSPTEIPVAATSLPAAGSVKMPCDWQTLFGSQAGRATFSRKFHCPTNLESHEQVVIVLSGVGGEGQIFLNGNPLFQFPAGSESPEVDVTQHLQRFNVLEVVLQFTPSTDTPATTGGLFGPVMIEIHS